MGAPQRFLTASRAEARCQAVKGSTYLSREGKNGKEVIQPHVPVRLPCYDFTPITNHNFIAYERQFRLQWAFVV